VGRLPTANSNRAYCRERGVNPGLYEHLLTLAIQRDLNKLADPRLYSLAPIDSEYVSHQGSRPMSIVWKLGHPVPARLFRVMARQNVG
jgi:hypothetical protein